jgi:hypothetical protein
MQGQGTNARFRNDRSAFCDVAGCEVRNLRGGGTTLRTSHEVAGTMGELDLANLASRNTPTRRGQGIGATTERGGTKPSARPLKER